MSQGVLEIKVLPDERNWRCWSDKRDNTSNSGYKGEDAIMERKIIQMEVCTDMNSIPPNVKKKEKKVSVQFED